MKYTAQLLTTLYDTEAPAEEFTVRHPTITFLDLSLYEEIEGFRRDMADSIARLESLVERLDLMREPVDADTASLHTYSLLIADEELMRRCEDLLAAGAHYDRVIREACVILEDRVRTVVGANKDVTGIPLMERAFSPKGGPLQLSGLEQEQLGAMQLYRGMMAFFRNDAGHHVTDTYSRDDALRFVGWVDFLLAMVAKARTI